MGKKKRFKTKLSRAQRRKNITVFASVVAGFYVLTLLFMVAIGSEDFSPLANTMDTILFYTVGILIISILPMGVFMFPVAIAGGILGSQKGKARRVRDDSTYVRVQDFEYYRDSLSHLTPSLVSLLIDLDLYGEKDITATLLRMYRKGAINLQDGNRISRNRAYTRELEGCEAELMSIIKEGRLSVKLAFAGWRDNRLKEAEELGYIRKKQTREEVEQSTKTNAALLFAIGSMFAGLGFLAFLFMGLGPISEGEDYWSSIILRMSLMLGFNAFLFIPWYRLMFRISYMRRDDILWERTPLGNEMAEKIAGLAKFIHDFSSLPQAQKEQVMLWDDYLVFAVVLEENERIVKDISKLCGINLRRFERF